MEALEESPAADDGAVGRGAWCFVRATRPTVFFEFFFFFHPLSLRTAARYVLPWQLTPHAGPIWRQIPEASAVNDSSVVTPTPSESRVRAEPAAATTPARRLAALMDIRTTAAQELALDKYSAAKRDNLNTLRNEGRGRRRPPNQLLLQGFPEHAGIQCRGQKQAGGVCARGGVAQGCNLEQGVYLLARAETVALLPGHSLDPPNPSNVLSLYCSLVWRYALIAPAFVSLFNTYLK